MTTRSRAMLTSAAVVAGLVVAAVTTEADAATVTLNSVSGVWTSTDPEADVRGVGTNEIRWGAPSPGSGYKFEGVTGGGETYNADQVFTTGTFTHFNQSISGNGSLEAATLKVDFDVTVTNRKSERRVLSSVFSFDHFETDNSGSSCANGGQNKTGVNINGCADRVKLTANDGASNTIVIDGVPHLLTLTGFIIDGDPASEFWTVENANNRAELKGVLTQQLTTTPVSAALQVTTTPVPAALPLLLTALASFGVVGYRRRQKA